MPRNFAETSEYFAWAIVDAPDFKDDGLTLDEGFAFLFHGLKIMTSRLKSVEAKELHVMCQNAVADSLSLLKNGDHRAGIGRLQDAWETFKRLPGAGLRSHEWDGPDGTEP